MPHAAQVIERLKQTSQGQRLLGLAGHVLNSGWSAVVPGGVYVMGLNPGGSAERGKSVEEQILNTPMGPRSAYNELWVPEEMHDHQRRVKQWPAGMHPHQVHVKNYLQALGLMDATTVPASNAYFLTSVDARELKALAKHQFGGLPALLQACWKVHEYLLSIIQPRIILCLGNDKRRGRSAVSILANLVPQHAWCRSDTDGDYRRGKWFTAQMSYSGGREVLVFGVPHPSRFPPGGAVMLSLAEQAKRAGCSPPLVQQGLAV